MVYSSAHLLYSRSANRKMWHSDREPSLSLQLPLRARLDRRCTSTSARPPPDLRESSSLEQVGRPRARPIGHLCGANTLECSQARALRCVLPRSGPDLSSSRQILSAGAFLQRLASQHHSTTLCTSFSRGFSAAAPRSGHALLKWSPLSRSFFPSKILCTVRLASS